MADQKGESLEPPQGGRFTTISARIAPRGNPVADERLVWVTAWSPWLSMGTGWEKWLYPDLRGRPRPFIASCGLLPPCSQTHPQPNTREPMQRRLAEPGLDRSCLPTWKSDSGLPRPRVHHIAWPPCMIFTSYGALLRKLRWPRRICIHRGTHGSELPRIVSAAAAQLAQEMPPSLSARLQSQRL
jgi:hypothetical protein